MLLRSSNRYANFLRALPLFSACSDQQLDRVAGFGTRAGVEQDQVVIAEGGYGHDFFVILSGRADVVRGGRHVASLEAGDWFGELAVLDGERRDASVVMQSHGELFVISRREFAALIDAVPTVTRKLLVGMARRLHTIDAAPATDVSAHLHPQRETELEDLPELAMTAVGARR